MPEQIFTLADVANAFEGLSALLNAQFQDVDSRANRFFFEDIETDILRILRDGLTEAEQAEIAGRPMNDDVTSSKDDDDVFAFTFSKEELMVLNRSINFWLVTARYAGRGQSPMVRTAEDVLRRVDQTIGVAERIEKRKWDRSFRKSGGAEE